MKTWYLVTYAFDMMVVVVVVVMVMVVNEFSF